MLVRLMRAMLQSGMDGEIAIASAGSREAAEELFGMLGPRGRPDIVLCDRELPDGVGEDIIASMRTFEALRDVPVLGVTASDDAKTHEKLVRAGALLVLTKSALRSQLLDVIRQHAA